MKFGRKKLNIPIFVRWQDERNGLKPSVRAGAWPQNFLPGWIQKKLPLGPFICIIFKLQMKWKLTSTLCLNTYLLTYLLIRPHNALESNLKLVPEDPFFLSFRKERILDRKLRAGIVCCINVWLVNCTDYLLWPLKWKIIRKCTMRNM